MKERRAAEIARSPPAFFPKACYCGGGTWVGSWQHVGGVAATGSER